MFNECLVMDPILISTTAKLHHGNVPLHVLSLHHYVSKGDDNIVALTGSDESCGVRGNG